MTNIYANPFRDTSLINKIIDRHYLEDQPEAAFGLFTSNFNGPYNTGNWLHQQYSRLYSQYAGQQALDPSKLWFDYLAGLDIQKELSKVSPYDRGERASVYAPRMRYI